MSATVLANVATTGSRDLQWLYGDICNLFPEAHGAFCAHVPDVSPDPAKTPQTIAAYHQRLRDPATAQAAADAWCTWEVAIFGGDIAAPGSRFGNPAFRLCFARIVTYYFSKSAWLKDRVLLDGAATLAHIPCTMIHNRFDPACPLCGP